MLNPFGRGWAGQVPQPPGQIQVGYEVELRNGSGGHLRRFSKAASLQRFSQRFLKRDIHV
jgi:hypothetical protein